MTTQTGTSVVNAVFDARERLPGSVRVHGRVIDKVVREASAGAVGVSRDDVDVEVSDWGGGLAVRVAAKLPIPDLSDTQAIRSQIPILERVHDLQEQLAREIARLTGREIRRVSFSVVGAIVPERKRVS